MLVSYNICRRQTLLRRAIFWFICKKMLSFAAVRSLRFLHVQQAHVLRFNLGTARGRLRPRPWRHVVPHGEVAMKYDEGQISSENTGSPCGEAHPPKERWLSGRRHRFRKPAYSQEYR